MFKELEYALQEVDISKQYDISFNTLSNYYYFFMRGEKKKKNFFFFLSAKNRYYRRREVPKSTHRE